MGGKKKQHHRILWCSVSRDDGTILAEAETILRPYEEEAVMQTANQLLSQSVLPNSIGKMIEETQDWSGTVVKNFVRRPKDEIRRLRQPPLKGMLLVADACQVETKRKHPMKLKRTKLSFKKRSSVAAVVNDVQPIDGSSSVRSKTLYVSAVCNPRHCTVDEIMTFLGVLAATVKNKAPDSWKDAHELGLQSLLAPLMKEWMADVSYLVTVAQLQLKVDTLTAKMQANVERLQSSTENADDLYEMSLVLMEKTKVFKKKSSDLRRQLMSTNMKVSLGVGAASVGVVGVIVIAAMLI